MDYFDAYCSESTYTYDTWKQIAENYELKCNFPHCIGAVDGKHVVIQVIFLSLFFIVFLFINLFTEYFYN